MASERRFIAENIRRVLLKEYLMKEVSRAGFGGLDVQRTPMGTRVTLTTERPGIVIGRRGASIKNLTRSIEEDFNFDNPQIEVQEVENANLNAQIMAEKLAFALERGWHFRRAGHSTVRRIMESGARGCQVVIAGKLTGQRHRTEKFKDGYIKFCGEPKLQFIDEGYAIAKLKKGVIGVSVDIMKPGARLPADVEVLNRTEAMDALPDLFEPKEAELVEEPVAAEGEEGLEEAVETLVEETVVEPAEAPTVSEEAMEAATGEPVEEPVEAPAEEPVEETVEAPAEEPVEETVEPSAEEPVEETVEGPVEEPPAEQESVAEEPASEQEAAEEPEDAAETSVEQEVTE